MKFEFNAKGKAEFQNPEEWARNKNTVLLVNRLFRSAVDADGVTDKERSRLNRWVALGWVKRSGEAESKRAAPKKAKKPKKAKTAVKRTVKPKPEPEQTGQLAKTA